MATRRPSRRSVPRKKYTVDAFDGIEDLVFEAGSASGSDSASSSGDGASDEDDTDEAEDAFRADAEPPEETDDDAMSGAEDDAAVEEESDNLASDAGEQNLDEAMSIASDDDRPRPTPKRVREKRVRLPEDEQIHVRAVRDDTSTKSSILDRRLYFLGPTPEDYQPVLEAERRWKHQPCLPNRKASGSHGGFAYTEAYIKEVRKSAQNWEWYSKGGGKKAFQQRQIQKELTSDEAQPYLQHDTPPERAVLMGPVQERRLYILKLRQCVALSDPFAHPSKDGKPVKKRPSIYKSGFLINLGARVHCLDWAPNQSGPKQYLAVAVKPKEDRTFNASPAPAFTAQPPSPTSIQVWEFSATPQNYIDKTQPPRLSILLCAAMGQVKEMKFCPMPCNEPDNLGLLACVSGDGFLRVFDLDRPSSNESTQNILVEKAAFEVKPPDTICTSLTWLSSSRIAAACANGFIAVWNLSKSPKENPRPEIYAGVSISYITSITSAWPSFPNLLICASLSGYLTLTDISRPHPSSPSATSHSTRRRVPQVQSPLIYSDHAHAIYNAEENLTVKAHTIRRFWQAFNTNKISAHSTAFAVSPCHPFVLAGTASGDVVGHNPIERVCGSTKVDLWQQKWFGHEWRRAHKLEREAAREIANEDEQSALADGTPEDTADATEKARGDFVETVIGTTGLARITEGYKAEQVTFSKGEGDRRGTDGRAPTVLYEESSAVTSLSWNPNLHVAGWAAAGMADGLLMIEDIAG